jgi:protein-S-isoprenylcysteine O-methyltransferase Ste14
MSFVLWLVATVAMLAVRAPHIRRSLSVKVVATREGKLDRALVASVSLGLLLPLLTFRDATIEPPRLVAGALCFAFGLWMLHRSHVDLGRNWSNTLELREGHALVVAGVYRWVRHPMYLALLLHGVGQALVLRSPLAGFSFLAAFGALVAVRHGSEEQMMRDAFGDAYQRYCAQTRRLVPGVW